MSSCVDKLVSAERKSHVTDAFGAPVFGFCAEEKKVSGGKRLFNLDSDRSLHVGIARYKHTGLPVDRLRESGAIDGKRARAAPKVTLSEKAFRQVRQGFCVTGLVFSQVVPAL